MRPANRKPAAADTACRIRKSGNNATKAILIACVAFTVTLLGGLFALRLKDRLRLILGGGAGAVVAVAATLFLEDSVPKLRPLLAFSDNFFFYIGASGLGPEKLSRASRALDLDHDDHGRRADVRDDPARPFFSWRRSLTHRTT